MLTATVTVHEDNKMLTFNQVVFPQIVPLIVDGQDAIPVGRAKLAWDDESASLLADLSVDRDITGITPPYTAKAGVQDATLVVIGDVQYLVGGFVANVSLISDEVCEQLFGRDPAWDPDEDWEATS